MRVPAVQLITRVAVLVLASVLAACATTPLPPPASYHQLLASAQEIEEAGNTGAALDLYARAAAADPAHKQPWQQIARINFAQGQHTRALLAAEETLQRDPADAIANDVYVASAMQIARLAMQRLLAAGAEPDDNDLVRAQQLVATMGRVFGDDALIADEVKARYARRAVEQYRAAQARPSKGRLPDEKRKPRPDPLDVLGGD